MSMFQNRLIKNFKARRKWLKQNDIEAYRIYEKDIPEYPYIIDIYRDNAVIWEKGNSSASDSTRIAHQEDIQRALNEVLQIPYEQMLVKERQRQKDFTQYERLQETDHRIIIKEGPAQFYINLYDYVDTGLFLDHRPLRNLVYQNCAQKKVLNLFSYTGSFSVYAALGGAQTTSVDMSNTYQRWAQDNFELNKIHLGSHEFITDNTFEFLYWAKSKNAKYDIIILDPPTFSKSKKMEHDFEVERDQYELITLTSDLLSSNGTLYFSNNKKNFKLDNQLYEAFEIRDITSQTIPNDFRNKMIHQCFTIKNP